MGQVGDPIWADCFGLIAPSPVSLKAGRVVSECMWVGRSRGGRMAEREAGHTVTIRL